MGVNNKLDDLYARVPPLDCKGLCESSCTRILMSIAEAQRLTNATGFPPVFNVETERCGYLKDGRCSVHKIRPLVCRLWGVAAELQCPNGCLPMAPLHTEQVRKLYELRRQISAPEYRPKDAKI